MESILIWLPLFVWLGVGGWALRHHVGQPDFKMEYAGLVLFFSIFLAPFSAGIALYELQYKKTQTTSPMKSANP